LYVAQDNTLETEKANNKTLPSSQLFAPVNCGVYTYIWSARCVTYMVVSHNDP